jgi:hypothetical protein
MYWKIRFRVNKSQNSPISTIRIDADDLREACLEVLSLYRSATILEYQEGDGKVKEFEVFDIGFHSHPIDPDVFSINKSIGK